MAEELRRIIGEFNNVPLYKRGAFALRALIDALLAGDQIPPTVELPEIEGYNSLTLEAVIGSAKEGPFLKTAKLAELIADSKIPVKFHSALGKYLADINAYGDDALAHLMLPTRAWNVLARGGIYTIPELHEFLQTDSIKNLLGGGEKMVEVVNGRLHEFDRQLAEYREQNA